MLEEATYEADIINTAEYLNTKHDEDNFVRIVKSDENNKRNMISTIQRATGIAQELIQRNESNYTHTKDMPRKIKLGMFLTREWKSEVTHGQRIRDIDKECIIEEDISLWLQRGDLKAETENEIMAVRDQELHTRYGATKIAKQKHRANADNINKLARQQTALYDRAHY